ncbi:MAG: hypothetical protein A2X18_03195 [Bacteroidetes bacterium GWF2_40_14]|nr:MAG: hypothetical protein A2X18_03195 [Bacteroidetes bacterium GWF2_40_14]
MSPVFYPNVIILKKDTVKRMKNYKKDIEIARLISRELSGNVSPDELQVLKNWLDEAPGNKTIYDTLKSQSQWGNRKKILSGYDQEKEWEKLERQIDKQIDKHRYFNRSLFRYAAAAVVILMITGTWFYYDRQQISLEQTAELQINNIVPGGNKAILTLGDGSKIVLDSARTGTLATQGGSEIIKQDDGRLLYANSSPYEGGQAGMNTIETPRGGEYFVELPDGSKAWLNAASSIKFPVEFNRKERRVAISGEVYFEVEKNKVPFIVEVVNKPEVKVLGTHFNVNAYADESTVRTTLVEGYVQVGLVILKPGQQSELNSEGVIRVKEVNTSLYTAWKDGRFIFKDTPLEDIMRNMSRWYDVDIFYADSSLKSLCFTGNIPRETSVEEIFILLGKTKRIQFQVTNKTITIMKEP